MTIVLDPTGELQPAQRQPQPRPQDLTGKRIGLLDISKPRGDVFLDRLAERLAEMRLETRRYQKPTFARVAPLALVQQIVSECDLVIEALAD